MQAGTGVLVPLAARGDLADELTPNQGTTMPAKKKKSGDALRGHIDRVGIHEVKGIILDACLCGSDKEKDQQRHATIVIPFGSAVEVATAILRGYDDHQRAGTTGPLDALISTILGGFSHPPAPDKNPDPHRPDPSPSGYNPENN
jgi:hypothetical protein